MGRITRRLEQDEKKPVNVTIHPEDVETLDNLAKRMVLSKDQTISRLLRQQHMVDNIALRMRRMEERIYRRLTEHRDAIIILVGEMIKKENHPDGE